MSFEPLAVPTSAIMIGLVDRFLTRPRIEAEQTAARALRAVIDRPGSKSALARWIGAAEAADDATVREMRLRQLVASSSDVIDAAEEKCARLGSRPSLGLQS